MDINIQEIIGDIPPITLFTSLISIILGGLASSSYEYSQLFFFSKRLVFTKGEWWRLITSFFYIGPLSFNFLIGLYMSAVYSMRLEKTCFYKKSADYVYMLLIGIVLITIMSCIYPSSGFLGMALHSMIIYVWCRKNPHINLQFIIIPMKAPYLPYALLLFHYFSYGKVLDSDITGMIAGHIYYYFSDILPKIAKARKWKRTEFLVTPSILKWLLRGIDKDFYTNEEEEEIPEALLTEDLEEANIVETEEVETSVKETKMDESSESNESSEDELRERHVNPE